MSSLLQYQSCWILSLSMYNRRLFGVPVHHIIRSDSVWNSLGLCNNSSSNSRSSSCSNSSSKSGSSSSSSHHVAPACYKIGSRRRRNERKQEEKENVDLIKILVVGEPWQHNVWQLLKTKMLYIGLYLL